MAEEETLALATALEEGEVLAIDVVDGDCVAESEPEAEELPLADALAESDPDIVADDENDGSTEAVTDTLALKLLLGVTLLLMLPLGESVKSPAGSGSGGGTPVTARRGESSGSSVATASAAMVGPSDAWSTAGGAAGEKAAVRDASMPAAHAPVLSKQATAPTKVAAPEAASARALRRRSAPPLPSLQLKEEATTGAPPAPAVPAAAMAARADADTAAAEPPAASAVQPAPGSSSVTTLPLPNRGGGGGFKPTPRPIPAASATSTATHANTSAR